MTVKVGMSKIYKEIQGNTDGEIVMFGNAMSLATLARVGSWKASRLKSDGVVMWRAAIQPRYRVTASVPNGVAARENCLKRLTNADPRPAHAEALS